MKKLFVLGSAFILLAGAPAVAQVSVGINLGEPVAPVYPAPGYVMAPDWPSEHYDIHRHRHNDYWAHHDARGHEEHHR